MSWLLLLLLLLLLITLLPPCSRQVNATAGSFAARQSSSLGMVERVRFAMARSASTDEARETCGAVAAPAAPEARPAGNFSIANAVGGEWRLIRDRAGE